jgi:hypothetical protein
MEAKKSANPTPKACLEDVLATAELAQRPSKPADYKLEAQVMAILAQSLADRPFSFLQVLVSTAVELCCGGTCGISLLETENQQPIFRWVALAGVLEKYTGGSTPRNFSPCGVTMDRGAPQLFIRPGRYFEYFQGVSPEIVEGLVIPFFYRETAFGTIWVVSHDPERRFDLEDARLMTRLGTFSAAGLRTVKSLQAAAKGT